jgi:hypothetical protein
VTDVPRRHLKAAALAAAVPSVLVTTVLMAGGMAGGSGEALLLGAGCFASLYPLLLFALARMGARRDWNRRGGRPDPFA